MVDFKTTWEKIIDFSPFSKEIIYKVGRNEKTIKAILHKNIEDYSMSEFVIEIKDIPLGENVKFVIDEVEYKIVSFEKSEVGTLKIWIEENK